MSRFWRVISWTGGIIVIAAGTMLLMGSFRHTGSADTELQQARLEAMARLWESRLEGSRLFFHDQMVRHNVLAALEHVEEWSDWRMKNKFDAIQSTWAKENGTPRGFAILTADDRLHTAIGDTLGLADAQSEFSSADASDITLLRRNNDHSVLLAMQYRPVPTENSDHPARVILLVDGASIFSVEGESPNSWMLLASPTETLMASPSTTGTVSVSAATWPLLLTEKSGNVPQSSGGTLCFVRLHIPGMDPMLLVESVAAHSSASLFLLFGLLALGTGAVLVPTLRKQTPDREPQTSAAKSSEETAPADTSGFRQIFQTIQDPLCVLDSTGQIVRANHSAQDWLRLNKGRPDLALTVQLIFGQLTISEYLLKALEDPVAASGLCRFTLGDDSTLGTATVTRLSRDEEGRGSVLIHFHPQLDERPVRDERAYMPPELPHPEVVPSGHDSHCPFPVLSVTPGGLVTSFNDAARQTCPRMEDTPLLSELLPGLDTRDIPSLLSAPEGTVFESLFGSSPHEFKIVYAEGQILLYGHRLSASKKLEVELKQAQESFYALCALSPSPVLLVDPRDHAILEANAAAADLFGFTPVDLRGQLLDSLTAEPWNFDAAEELYIAASTTGTATRCTFHYELIKIEGLPTLLVVLEPLPEYIMQAEPITEFVQSEPDSETVAEAPAATSTVPSLPLGPGLLVTMNPTVREVARRLFEKAGHPCEVFSSLDDATVWLITHSLRPELAALDLTDFDDAETWLEELRSRCGDVPCVAFTDGADYHLPSGPNELLVKPFDLESLTASLSALHVENSACISS